MKPSPATTTAVISAIAILCVLGLGGVAAADGDEPLTKKQFIREADNVCRRARARTRRLEAKFFGDWKDPKLDPATLAAFVEANAPVIQNAIDRVRALEEPKADRKRVNRMLDALQGELDAVADDPSALLVSDPDVESDHLAQAYGFAVCGQRSPK
jgi:hypothetical protein